MQEFLIGIQYHYPDTYELWNQGIVEDFEASTGLFIRAESIHAALQWGKEVAVRLLNYVHDSDGLTLEQFDHDCWYEASPTECSWSHCLDFFQHVSVGEMPNLSQMTADAYGKWYDEHHAGGPG